ncbi:hypothetical protein B5M42_018755 [Paenibacillus athensensis]|uniref:Uncharacterized protein n=1 Tax=Paenibacillus athensensis TaxID=1967502 RepID=A0A4Y8Q4I3_9BACL|nr:DUF6470 family protein [Paenibacillus athensensis]MCD1260846.1 hypothetical protein [Paenibacillus athensensis]
MPSIPQIQIRQQPALLGIDADLGTQDIKQPRPTYEMENPAARLEIRQPRGDLEIDQSRAWDALGQGPILQAMNRIYSQAHNVAMQGIARIVENGNRLAAINIKGANPIADIAEQLQFEHPEFDYYGEASYDNVDITYTPHKPEIDVTPNKVNVNARVNPPEVNYNRGKLDIYMQQYPKVEISVPQIDLKL